MTTPYLKIGEQSHLRMLFDGATLFLRRLKCLKGNDEHFKAASGNARTESIPNGIYWIQSNEVHKMSPADDWTPRGFSKPTIMAAQLLEGNILGALPNAMILHMAAWGDFRIPIRQTVSQEESTGRKNMFIHGGDSYGSAGCIDLSHGINIFVSFLLREHPDTSNYWIELVVQKAA